MVVIRNFSATAAHVFRSIILIGAPGTGKGTYGGLLSKDINYRKISTGDEIRKLLKKENLSDEMLEIKKLVSEGKFISDQMALDLVAEAGENLGQSKGVMLDGVPRTVAQFRMIEQTWDLKKMFAINFTLKEDILIEKLTGRRVCEDCGQNFNICSISQGRYEMEPLLSKKGDHCDCCNGKLVHRDDDQVSVIKARLDTYHE
jgi:adenylate kinase